MRYIYFKNQKINVIARKIKYWKINIDKENLFIVISI